jgi:hypothetical protein
MMSSQAQYDRGTSASLLAANALSLTALNEPRRQHQAFLRAGDGDVDAPLGAGNRSRASDEIVSTINSAG